MNKEFVQKWITALRSGEYKQCTGQLGEIDSEGNASYCCLGVATELAIADGLDLDRELSGGSIFYISPEEVSDDCADERFEMMPPESVKDHAGFGDRWEVTVPSASLFGDEEYYEDQTEIVELSSLNDEHDWTFGQIADALEANLKDAK